MRVFDFDNTIYDGESSYDFFKFCLKRKKSLIIYMPKVIYNLVRYKIGRVGMNDVYDFCDEMMSVFFKNKAYVDYLLDYFWKMNERKLKPSVLKLVSENDAIISASPEFLLEPIRNKLKANTLICTKTEGDHLVFLCYGKNKVKAFDEYFGDKEVEEFYTDSINDMPMMKKAKRTFLVKGKVIKEVKCE